MAFSNSLPPYRQSVAQLCQSYGVDPEIGLVANSVQEHTRRFGKNALDSKVIDLAFESIQSSLRNPCLPASWNSLKTTLSVFYSPVLSSAFFWQS